MRFLVVMTILLWAAFSKAEVQNFNGMIQEASSSEKILRKRLLRILNSQQVAVAANEQTPEQLQTESPSQDFEVRLVQARH